MKTEQGWAIASVRLGLYIGWWHTRAEAIAGHVNALAGTSNHAWGGKLDANQRAEWEMCKRKGDRAVKVRISYR